MADLVIFNGLPYTIPVVDDEDWGANVTDFLVAIPAGCLQKTGGAFTLTADANFGASFGLLSVYFKSRAANPASSGLVRLTNSDLLCWRNAANSGNNTLGVNGSDQLIYNGSPLEFNALTNGHIFVGNALNVATDIVMSGDIGISNAGVTAIQAGVVTNADVNASAAIAYTKLNLAGSILNSDIYSNAAIAYSKLNLAGSILNADINVSAAIAYSKLNLATSIVNADINASAAIAYSKLALTGGIVNADINASAAIAYSKLSLAGSVSLTTDITGTLAVTHGGTGLATLSQGDLLYGSASNTLSSLAKSATATRYLANTGTTNNPAWDQVNLTNGVTGTLPVGSGGTGQTSYTDGQLLIGRTDTGLLSKATLTGTANQIVVTNGTASITLSTPQSIGTGSSPTFAGLTLSSPLSVANGGTGDASLTAYAVLCGGTTTTGAVQSIAALGSSGQVLTSNGAGALPTFQSVSGSGTVNSGTAPRLAFYATTGAAVSAISSDASMNSQKITSLANGTASTDAAAFGQIHVASLPTIAFETTGGSTSSSSFSDAGATISITPTSSSSKIMIWAVAPFNGTVANDVGILGISGTTTGDLFTTANSPGRAQGIATSTISLFTIDSPGTTSAQTYKLRIASNGVGTAAFGAAAATGARTQIMVQEVI